MASIASTVRGKYFLTELVGDVTVREKTHRPVVCADMLIDFMMLNYMKL